MIIKGFEEEKKPAFNGDTLEWRGRKLKEMQKRELIDIVVNMFTINLALQEEMKEHKRILS